MSSDKNVTQMGPSREEILRARNNSLAQSAPAVNHAIELPVAGEGGASPNLVEKMQSAREDARTSPATEAASAQSEIDRAIGIDEAIELGPIAMASEELSGNPFMTEAYRSIVEQDLIPISMMEALTGRVKQVVSIVPGKMQAEFHDLTGEDAQLVESLASKESQDGSINLYLQTKTLVYLAAGLTRLGPEALPTLLDENGRSTEALLRARYKIVQLYSTHLLNMLIANHSWFETRVRRAISPDAIKNL